MVGGILYEHGHRLVAAAVSTLVGLEMGVLLFFLEGRKTVKRLAAAAFGAILLQAVLGGLTVLFLLPPAISSAHAALAEIVFALTAVVALMCSRTWTDLTAHPPSLPLEENLSSNGANARSAFRWTLAATAAIYVQIVLGAVMRHTGAGLAIPDFPTAFGGLLPSAADLARRGVPIHLAHRLGALVVLVLVAGAVRALARASAKAPLFASFAAAWTGLVTIQMLLGALSIWSRKAPSPHGRPPRHRRPLLGDGRPRPRVPRGLPESGERAKLPQSAHEPPSQPVRLRLLRRAHEAAHHAVRRDDGLRGLRGGHEGAALGDGPRPALPHAPRDGARRVRHERLQPGLGEGPGRPDGADRRAPAPLGPPAAGEARRSSRARSPSRGSPSSSSSRMF